MNNATQNTPIPPLLDLSEFADRRIIRTIPFPVRTPRHQHLLETNSCTLYYTGHGILTFHAITPSILEEYNGDYYSERLIIATAHKGFTTYLAYDPLWSAPEEKNMNKQRRKEIENLHDELQNLHEKMEMIMEEEEEYKDNLPENMLNRIEQSENAACSMMEASENIAGAINNLEEIE